MVFLPSPLVWDRAELDLQREQKTGSSSLLLSLPPSQMVKDRSGDFSLFSVPVFQ